MTAHETHEILSVMMNYSQSRVAVHETCEIFSAMTRKLISGAAHETHDIFSELAVLNEIFSGS
ncbi:MAG: hypothetical protein IJU48_04455 [Synergistaceae bacterium]|nr:hypothetical protein [Synergistaceae bacterium]